MQIGEKAFFCMEILSDFIFTQCVFFMPLVLGYAEHVDVPSAVTALGTRRIEYAYRAEIVASASKFLGLFGVRPRYLAHVKRSVASFGGNAFYHNKC